MLAGRSNPTFSAAALIFAFHVGEVGSQGMFE